jgi:hypothetical protein
LGKVKKETEFGPKLGEIEKKKDLQKSTSAFKRG